MDYLKSHLLWSFLELYQLFSQFNTGNAIAQINNTSDISSKNLKFSTRSGKMSRQASKTKLPKKINIINNIKNAIIFILYPLVQFYQKEALNGK